MIKRIELTNFQAHKHSVFDFSNGVNALVGKSDQGKTSCIRALNWVLTNRPSGESFINHDAFVDNKQIAPCIVTIVTDKHTIQRERSATRNSYTIDTTELKAVGVDVPQEVVDAMNMNDINIQFQLDSPFLLTETSGEVARKLNKVVKLDDIDATLRQLNTYSRRLGTQRDQTQYQIDAVTKDIEAIQLQDIENTVELAEALYDKYTMIEQQSTALYELDYEIRCIYDRLQHATDIDTMLELCEQAIVLHTQYEKLQNTYTILDTIVNDIDRLNESIASKHLHTLEFTNTDELVAEYTALATKLQQLDDIMHSNDQLKTECVYDAIDTDTVDTLLNMYESVEKDQKALDTLLQEIVYCTSEIENKQASVEELERELKDMLGDTCPVCGSKL